MINKQLNQKNIGCHLKISKLKSKKDSNLDALCNPQIRHSLNAWKNASLSAFEEWEGFLPAQRFWKKSRKKFSPTIALGGKVSKNRTKAG